MRIQMPREIVNACAFECILKIFAFAFECDPYTFDLSSAQSKACLIL